MNGVLNDLRYAVARAREGSGFYGYGAGHGRDLLGANLAIFALVDSILSARFRFRNPIGWSRFSTPIRKPGSSATAPR